ncbi:MAG: tetratricopeptide (TPR) repeat protein [Lentimonas sp.]|jgi:tetratricopeptide (TPR) repeat protein
MKTTLFLIALFASSLVQAQNNDLQLANLYYSKGEYEKAAPYSEKVYDQDPSKTNFFRLFDCYKRLDDTRGAEKLLKKQISRYRYDFEYPVMLGAFYEESGDDDKALKVYENIIDDLPDNRNSVINVYNAFRANNKNDLALQTLQKGKKTIKGNYPLQIQFADLYGAMGENERMIDEYLDLLNDFPNYESYVQNILSRKIDFSESGTKEYDHLKTALLDQVQKKPQQSAYTNMLVWLFIQSKNFNGALVQVQALDKRQRGGGFRVFDLGRMCLENKEYETARKAFRYVKDLGETNPLYYRAEAALLNTRFIEVTTNRKYSAPEISAATNEYREAIKRLGAQPTTISLIKELAHIEAFYGAQPDSAMLRLNEALQIGSLTDVQRAELKVELADILVLNGDIWEASLYYMQVDKDFKYEPIGQEAKFKNARIFYYDSEFDFAQSQLDVLKQATSKLIANDAMELSLLITENFGIDSNYQAMGWFARAELLIAQHKYGEAYLYFDSIQTAYNYHSLGDEILLKKAEAEMQQGKWDQAIVFLDELLKFYAFDILADDAVFYLGDIYENQLNDPVKAEEYYKKILFDYKGSLHSTEARKRFRRLRGDNVESEEL